MDIRKHMGGRFLNANHIDHEADTTVTITKVYLDDVEDRETEQTKEMVCVAFAEFDGKVLGLNEANKETLCELLGWDTDAWVGKRIAIWVNPDIQFAGRAVGGIRVRSTPPRGRGRAPAKRKRAKRSR